MSNMVNQVAPWIDYYRQVEALFKGDPEVSVMFNEDTYTLKLFVDNAGKAEALTKLMPVDKVFGNITVNIAVIPMNAHNDSKINLFRRAFEGNDAVSYIHSISDIATNDYNYVVFKKEVVQYYNDSLGDPHGMCSTLYQDIAKNIFEDQSEGIFFSTDRE